MNWFIGHPQRHNGNRHGIDAMKLTYILDLILVNIALGNVGARVVLP